MNVILSETKNLLSGNTLSTLSMVGFEGMLRLRSAYSANEIATSGNALLAMTVYSITLAMTEYSITLAMTYYNT